MLRNGHGGTEIEGLATHNGQGGQGQDNLRFHAHTVPTVTRALTSAIAASAVLAIVTHNVDARVAAQSESFGGVAYQEAHTRNLRLDILRR